MQSSISLRRFQSQSGSGHPGPLSWDVSDDVPVLNSPNMATRQEVENSQFVYYFSSARWRMWVPAEKEEFDGIMDHITNQWYVQTFRHNVWVEAEQSMVVWLEWYQPYRVIAPSRIRSPQ